ncbi:chorismate mutase [Candidatus Pacearchaeota archaeon]|nr:chorismate mutase [Candidatus Pacearchaeota archaeon]
MLNRLRKQIDRVDNKLSNLLDKRAETVKKIGKEKKKLKLKIVSRKREKEILRVVAKNKKNKQFIRNVFKKIITESRKLQF